MGRSRGGLTTKIHALVDALGLPILLKLTEGQAHDGRSASDMLDGLGEGCILLGDRAYDSDAMRATLAERGAWACVKPMPNRKRFPAFSPFLYRYRNPGLRRGRLSSNGSSANSSIPAPSPRDTTNATITSSPQSNSLPLESG